MNQFFEKYPWLRTMLCGLMAAALLLSVLLPVLRLWYVFRADSTPAVREAYMAGALGYFILPVDLIPDALGLFGFSDDLGVVLMITKWVSELITPEIEAQAHYRKLTPCLRSADTRLVTK